MPSFFMRPRFSFYTLFMKKRINMNTQLIWNRNFFMVWMSTFLLFTVFYSLLTSMPIYVTDALGGGGNESGLVISIFIIASVLFRLFWEDGWINTARNRLLFYPCFYFLFPASYTSLYKILLGSFYYIFFMAYLLELLRLQQKPSLLRSFRQTKKGKGLAIMHFPIIRPCLLVPFLG